MKMKKNPYMRMLINKILYCIITFVANVFLTRALGITLKGEYTWLIDTANLCSIVMGLGIYQSIPYFSRIKENVDIVQDYLDIFSTQTFIYFLGFLILIIFYGYKFNLAVIGLLAITNTLNQQLNMLMLVDRIAERNRIYLISSVLNLFFSFLCFTIWKNNLVMAVVGMVIVKSVTIIGYIVISGKVPHPFSIKWKLVWEKISYGFIAMCSFLMITFNYKIDVQMLKIFENVNSENLSLYTVGVSIAEIAWVIPDCFKEVLFSRTSREGNDEEVAAALRICNAVIWLSIIGVLLIGRYVIIVFFGTEFENSYYVTVLLFLGIPAMSWFKIVYTLFIAKGKRKISFYILLISSIMNIFLNALMIPEWGIYGAALASIISYSLCGCVFLMLYCRDSHNRLKDMFLVRRKDITTILGR